VKGIDLLKILGAWLIIPLTALSWVIAWHRLPERVAMKLDAGGRPIGWAPRHAAMTFDLKVLAGVLTFATVIAFLIAFVQPGKARLAPNVVIFCAAFVGLLLNGILWVYQVP
jgi:hypothetical protein